MARDLKDAWGWLERLTRRVDRLFSGAMFENASITNGRLRLIGGLLRVDSGGRVQIVGTLEINGTTTVTGVFDVEGPWDLAGDGSITGNVSIAGNVTATGIWTQIGEWHLNGNGSITGDVDITGILTLLSELIVSSVGKITVGAGASRIVIDGATGKILVGNMTIDPANGGSVVFPGGAVVKAGPSGGISMTQGSYAAVITSTGASVGRSGRSISVTESGFRMDGVPTGSPGNGTQSGVFYRDGLGYIKVSDGS